MNDSEFNVGDVVFHKSNPSIRLVVSSVRANNVECSWITEKGDLHWGTFNYHEIFKPDEK